MAISVTQPLAISCPACGLSRSFPSGAAPSRFPHHCPACGADLLVDGLLQPPAPQREATEDLIPYPVAPMREADALLHRHHGYANAVALTAKVSTIFSLKVSNTIRYLNLPVAGFKNTDAVTAVALVATAAFSTAVPISGRSAVCSTNAWPADRSSAAKPCRT